MLRCHSHVTILSIIDKNTIPQRGPRSLHEVMIGHRTPQFGESGTEYAVTSLSDSAMSTLLTENAVLGAQQDLRPPPGLHIIAMVQTEYHFG
jgi:hypothetical protein